MRVARLTGFRIAGPALLTAVLLPAQPAVAPTDAPTGPPRGENVSGYNIRQSFEAGYRWRTVDGNEGMYRSTVNFGDGIRLLASSLSVQSVDGHGRWFDQLSINTQGLGNDPYESASLRVEKNRLYRYELLWRSDAYFNPALTVARGQHRIDTTRHLQDQDLTLFPQSNFRLFFGYSRNTQGGPALSTIQLFDSRGDEFPLFNDVRRQQNEYRLGGEIKVMGFRLNILRGWVDFREDTPTILYGTGQGINPDDLTELVSFHRAEPYHGTSHYWRGVLFRENRWFAVNGRITYVAGKRDFVLDETSAGTDRFGAATRRQVITSGDAQRPTVAGNFTVSVFPVPRVTVTNQTSVQNIRMLGNSYFTQIIDGRPLSPSLPFSYLGIFTRANATNVDVRVSNWLGVHGGYQASLRRIGSREGAGVVGGPAPDPTTFEQNNRLNAGFIGLRIKPIKPLTINLDGEQGRNDHPIYPISEKDYHALRGRVELKQRSYRLAGYARSDYNTNSVSLANFASRSRQFGVDGSWNARNWFAIDAGYGHQHLDTLGGIAYFTLVNNRSQLVTGDQSYYLSNVHTASLAGRFEIRQRVDISLGYSHIQDVGGDRKQAYTSQPAFLAAQTFPLHFRSPLVRVSVKLTNKLRWNAGYQHYGYGEELLSFQDFRAHTGYSSISWSF